MDADVGKYNVFRAASEKRARPSFAPISRATQRRLIYRYLEIIVAVTTNREEDRYYLTYLPIMERVKRPNKQRDKESDDSLKQVGM